MQPDTGGVTRCPSYSDSDVAATPNQHPPPPNHSSSLDFTIEVEKLHFDAVFLREKNLGVCGGVKGGMLWKELPL